jgi:signal transduction histidine kinase
VSADALLQYLTWALYGAVFVLVAARTVRLPTRAHADTTLFFGAVALLILLSAAGAINPPPPRWLNIATAALLLALPWLLLRLVADFATVPAWLAAGAPAGWLLAVVAVAALPAPLPAPLALLLVAYFVTLMGYDAWALLRTARLAAGVTRRRLRAAALGSGFLAAVLAFAGLGVVLPAGSEALGLLGRLAGLASGPCYLVGFAPPAWLRRAWQEPELRAYFDRAAGLPYLADEAEAVRALEDGAAAALGGGGGSLGLWSERAGVLRFYRRPTEPPGAPAPDPAAAAGAAPEFELRPGQMVAGRAFAAQRPVLATDAPGEDPENAEAYRAAGVGAALAAPVTAGERRLGVLVVHARRAPVFAAGDLELLRLLAEQAALVLERRALLAEVGRARAREEAERLKDEFLAALSHDLRNPLAAAHGTAQVLARRLERQGTVAPEALAAGLANVVAATAQMAALIDELLDVARLRAGRPLILERRPADLVTLVRRTTAGHAAASERHRVRLEAVAPALPGMWDEPRLERVLQNLLNNAVKFSPAGGDVAVRVWQEAVGDGPWAAVSVQDQGLGIPAADLPHVFEPFRRGSNVAGRVPGTGLGLAAARHIVEQHGGRLTVESEEGRGSTFTVWLPLGAAASPAPPPPESPAAPAPGAAAAAPGAGA